MRGVIEHGQPRDEQACQVEGEHELEARADLEREAREEDQLDLLVRARLSSARSASAATHESHSDERGVWNRQRGNYAAGRTDRAAHPERRPKRKCPR